MLRGFVAWLGAGSARLAPGLVDPDGFAAESVALQGGRGCVTARRGSLAAVADLRLDNRDELLGRLRGRLAEGRVRDVDLLLAAYEAWGAEAVTRLEGPFSFVVWEDGERRAHYARDGMGLRPLYRAVVPGGIVFASSLPRLRALVPSALRSEAVHDHLRGRLDHPSLTFASAIERVPPGHSGTVEVGEGSASVREERRFWSPHPASVASAPGDAPWEAGLRERFDRAVDSRLGNGVGAFLSGGLDSSSVVTTARLLRPGTPLPTFSIVYDDPAADEKRFVDAVAERAGVPSHRIGGEGLSLLGGLDADLAAVGEPFFTPNLFLTRTLYGAARDAGLRAVLDGFAGDDVVGHGDLFLTELAFGFRWRALVREATAVARRTRQPRRTVLRLLKEYALDPLARPLRRPPAERHFAHPDLVREAPAEPTYRTVRAAHRATISGPTLPRAFEVAYAAAAAAGVEPRYPFADRRLVELCLALPPEQRLRDGLTRSILRRAMADRLPPALLARPGKARLGDNFVRLLFERDRDVLRRIVYEDAPRAADLLDVPALQQAVERADREAGVRSELALPVWRAATLARWIALEARR